MLQPGPQTGRSRRYPCLSWIPSAHFQAEQPANSTAPPGGPDRRPKPPRKAVLPPDYEPAVAPGMMPSVAPSQPASRLSPERLQAWSPDLPPKPVIQTSPNVVPRKIPPVPPPKPPRRLPLGDSPENVTEHAQERLSVITEEDSQQADLTAPAAGKKKRRTMIGRGSKMLNIPVGPDPYFKSDKVMGLSIFNFDSFIHDHEKTLIMFFDSLKDENVSAAKEFANASTTSTNRKHAFGSVNCSVDSELCCREQVSVTPTFKLFSNGFNVCSISYLNDFNANRMNMLLAMSPLLNQARTEMRK